MDRIEAKVTGLRSERAKPVFLVDGFVRVLESVRVGRNSPCLSYLLLASLPPSLRIHCPKDFLYQLKEKSAHSEGELDSFHFYVLNVLVGV